MNVNMNEKLTGYKKKMAMLGLKMLQEENGSQAENAGNIEKSEKGLHENAIGTEFK